MNSPDLRRKDDVSGAILSGNVTPNLRFLDPPGPASIAPPRSPPRSLEWGGEARPRDENFLRGERGRFRDPVLCQSVSESVSESRSGRGRNLTFRGKCTFALLPQKVTF